MSERGLFLFGAAAGAVVAIGGCLLGSGFIIATGLTILGICTFSYVAHL